MCVHFLCMYGCVYMCVGSMCVCVYVYVYIHECVLGAGVHGSKCTCMHMDVEVKGQP